MSYLRHLQKPSSICKVKVHKRWHSHQLHLRRTPLWAGAGNYYNVTLSFMVTLPYPSFLSFYSCCTAAEAELALTRFLLGTHEWPRQVLEVPCWKIDACLSMSKAVMPPCWLGFQTLRFSCSKTPVITSMS